MANLYEIENAILECVDMETGEIIEPELLDQLCIERDKKVEGIALWIKNLVAEAAALKAEKQMFAKREQAVNNKITSLKEYLGNYLGGEKFTTTRVKISYRKSEVVEVADTYGMDDDYLIYVEPTLNKAKIKDAIKQGIDVKGAKLIEKQNIQIK